MHSHHLSVRWLYLLMILAAIAFPPRAHAAEPGDELRIYMLTMQPGEAVFEKFGHNAIWVRDDYAGTDVVYNWGMFEFERARFFVKYALGQMDYSMIGTSENEPARTIGWYGKYENRTIWQQELNLTPAQRLKLRDFLRWNEQPENATYRYNYYTDNCSTRVRDAIDGVLDGRPIQKQLQAKPTDTTFRWHTRRCTRDSLFWYAALHTVLGPLTDRKINAWEECFLPPRLRDRLAEVTITDASGATVPLVKSELILFQSNRPPEAAAPPNWVVQFFLTGVAVGAVLVGLAHWARRSRAGRAAFAIVATLLTALMGLGAAISLWFWVGSDHWAAWRNESLFAYSPLALPLAFLLPVIFRNWPRAKRAAAWLAVAIVATTILGILLAPLLPQSNAEPLAFILPINLALAWSVWRLARPQPSVDERPGRNSGAARSSRQKRSTPPAQNPI